MRKGFTLIELLVVIAIIAILAAILFPVFMRAKQAANTTKCMSHGRELGLAMQGYMDDNSGRFPSAATDDAMAKYHHITWRYHWPPHPASRQVWSVSSMNQMAYIQLAPYVRNTQIFICPAPTTLYSMKYAYGYRCSWFFRNGNLGQNDYPDTPFVYQGSSDTDPKNGMGLTATEVQALDMSKCKRNVPPSKKFFAWCYSLGEDIPVIACAENPIPVTPSFAHDEGSVFVYLDGHARYKEMGKGFAPVRYTNKPIDEPHLHLK
jgi:prepilin-type N-terminal cleavage/methylation domain-containing protein